MNESSISQAVKSGANDAKKKAAEIVPAAKNTIGRTVYGACYYVSYGLHFPTYLVGSFIPKDSAVARGMADGAQSARHAVDDIHARRTARRSALAAARDEAVLIEQGVESLAGS